MRNSPPRGRIVSGPPRSRPALRTTREFSLVNRIHSSRLLLAAAQGLGYGLAVWGLIAVAIAAPLVAQQRSTAAHRNAVEQETANQAAVLVCHWSMTGQLNVCRSEEGLTTN